MWERLFSCIVSCTAGFRFTFYLVSVALRAAEKEMSISANQFSPQPAGTGGLIGDDQRINREKKACHAENC